jgi:hypothetical protein
MWWFMPAIPATQEQRSGALWFEASPDKNVMISHLNKVGMVAHTCHPSYAGAISRRITI